MKEGDWMIGIKGPRLGCVARYIEKKSVAGYTVRAYFPGTLRGMCGFGGDEPVCGNEDSWWRPMTEHEVRFYTDVAIPITQTCPKCGSSGGIHKTDCSVAASGAMKVEAPEGDAFVMGGDNSEWIWTPFWTTVKRHLFESSYDLSKLRRTLGLDPSSMLRFLEEMVKRDECGEMR